MPETPIRSVVLVIASLWVVALGYATEAQAQTDPSAAGFHGEEPEAWPDETPAKLPAKKPARVQPRATVKPQAPAATPYAAPSTGKGKKVIVVPSQGAVPPASTRPRKPVGPVQMIVPTKPLKPAKPARQVVVPVQAKPQPKQQPKQQAKPGPTTAPGTLKQKPAPPAAKGAAAKSDPADEGEFIEGELAGVGSVGLVPWKNRFGVVVGIERLGEIFFIGIKPQINWSRDLLDRPFSMSFGIPFRLQLLDSRSDRRWDKAGRPRAEDWDEPSDWAQILRFVQWGGKEKHFFLNITQFESSSLGHGTIMKRYNQNLNFNTRRVSFQLDGFTDYFGGETYLNDITGPNVLGALLFLKPLSLINRENYAMRSFSLGFSMAADIDAPLRNHLDFDDVDDDGRRQTEIRIDQGSFQPEYVSTSVIAYGIDAEVKMVDTSVVDWKTYMDYSWLESGVPTDDPERPLWANVPTRAVRSGGFTWGQLFRINAGRAPKHALRIRAEYRSYDYNYLPSYFDILYEVQRIQPISTNRKTGTELANETKLQRVLGRDPDGPRVHGGYLETSWRIGQYFAMAFGLELNNQTDDDSMFLHVEVPRLGPWQFMATYHRRTASGFADLWSLFSGNNDLFVARTRYGLGDLFHVTLEALTPFGIGPESFFRSTVQVNLNVEMGFSY